LFHSTKTTSWIYFLGCN